MQNFDYYTPTRLIFGKGSISKLRKVIEQKGKRVLLTYGGGSIKKIGLYDRVIKELSGLEVYELAGIEPNPKYTKNVVPGVKICKEKHIDVILAVGGGSVLDCSKAIAAGACYKGETEDLIRYKVKAKAALPIVDILTLAATGSEFDDGAVITIEETNDKIGYIDELLFPYASILDPEYTFSVSKKQTAAGTIDAINHVLESYFCEDGSILTDGMCEATIRSLIYNGKLAIKEPDNYQARAELMVDCSLACNGILCLGNGSSGWPMHGIEHVLSAYYDITHGEGLAIITPRWMKKILSYKTIDRFVSLGEHVFNIDPGLSKEGIAELTIEKIYKIFEELGSPMHLKEVGIDESRLSEMAHHICQTGRLKRAWVPLEEEDVLELLKECL